MSSFTHTHTSTHVTPTHITPHTATGRGHEIDVDQDFLERYDAKLLKSTGPDTDVRMMWVVLRTLGRREGVKAIMDRMSEGEGDAHNITRTYFWIQMVRRLGARVCGSLTWIGDALFE